MLVSTFTRSDNGNLVKVYISQDETDFVNNEFTLTIIEHEQVISTPSINNSEKE